MIFEGSIILNLYKHHKNFIKEEIEKVKTEVVYQKLLNELVVIGNSQIDIYLGNISPNSIKTYAIQFLLDNDINNENNYKAWILSQNKGYQLVDFPDLSRWTFRIGNDNGKYIHIHPGRNSFLTTRVKATTLKTAVAFIAYSKINGINNASLEIINELRHKYFHLSKIKSLEAGHDILRVIELLRLSY